MNFSSITSPETVGGWISLGIYGILILSLLGGIIAGLCRGFTKTLVRIITIAAAAVVAFILTTWAVGYINDFLAGKPINEAISSVWSGYETTVDAQTREIIGAFDPETAQLLVVGIVALLVTPIAFVAIFVIARIIMYLVDWIICAILRRSNRNKGAASTIFGMLLGIVQGVLFAAIILLPVSGMLTLADGVKTELLASENISDGNKEKIESFYAQYLDDAIDNPIVPMINEFGGDKFYAEISKATVGEETYNMPEHATTIAAVSLDAVELAKLDWKSPTPEQQATIRVIAANLGNDEYTVRLLAGILRGASTALTENVEAFGLEAPYDDLFREAFSIFATSDETNVGADLDTMLDVYFMMADNEVLVLIAENRVDELKDKLTEKTDDTLLIDRIIDTLQENDRTAPLVTLFTKLSVSIMADSLGLDQDAVEIYENIKSDFNEILAIDRESFSTEEEYKAEVNNQVSAALESNGIELDAEIVSSMSDYIADNFSDLEEITDADVNDAILSYYSAYVDYLNNGGEIPEIPEIPEL